MSEFERKYALECLRLEADCRQLAQEAHTSSLQSHFLAMAIFWSELAVQEPSEDTYKLLAKASLA